MSSTTLFSSSANGSLSPLNHTLLCAISSVKALHVVTRAKCVPHFFGSCILAVGVWRTFVDLASNVHSSCANPYVIHLL